MSDCLIFLLLGVHALHNTGHFDLLPSKDKSLPPSPRDITRGVNAWLIKRKFDIQVSSTLGVPASFHSRYDVLSRSYLYKLAIIPSQLEFVDHNRRFHQWLEMPYNLKRGRRRSQGFIARNQCVLSKLSLMESDKIFDLNLKPGQKFDLDLFTRTLKLMEGTHNFSNFSKIQGLFKYKTVNGQKYTPIPRTIEERTRTISSVEVSEQPSPLPTSIYPLYNDNGVRFIDVVIHGQSFLHNQVRRMVGAAIAVATNKRNIEHIEELVNNPDKGWDNNITPAQPRGLYLAHVSYKPGALDQATDIYEEVMQLEKVLYDPSIDKECCDNEEEIPVAKNVCDNEPFSGSQGIKIG